MDNWGKLILRVLYKGHAFSKRGFAALLSAYSQWGILWFDNHKIRVVVLLPLAVPILPHWAFQNRMENKETMKNFMSRISMYCE